MGKRLLTTRCPSSHAKWYTLSIIARKSVHVVHHRTQIGTRCPSSHAYWYTLSLIAHKLVHIVHHHTQIGTRCPSSHANWHMLSFIARKLVYVNHRAQIGTHRPSSHAILYMLSIIACKLVHNVPYRMKLVLIIHPRMQIGTCCPMSNIACKLVHVHHRVQIDTRCPSSHANWYTFSIIACILVHVDSFSFDDSLQVTLVIEISPIQAILLACCLLAFKYHTYQDQLVVLTTSVRVLTVRWEQ